MPPEMHIQETLAMLIGYVSDEYYAALSDAAVELHGPNGSHTLIRSWPSGAVHADLPAGEYEVCFAKSGFGSSAWRAQLEHDQPMSFRLLSDRLLGYAWPKWCRGGDPVEFRMHTVEPYKLGLWRYGLRKEFIRNVGWYDNPRAAGRACRSCPTRISSKPGVAWSGGHSVHRQVIAAPERAANSTVSMPRAFSASSSPSP